MSNNVEKSDQRIKKISDSLNNTSKFILALIFVIAIFGNAWLIVKNVTLKKELQKTQKKYNSDIKRSSEQYSILYNKNLSLQSQLQNVNLKLIETINNTVEIQVMIQQIEHENVSLLTIRDRLAVGINKTNSQLKSLQKSVNVLIDKKQKVLDKKTEEFIDKN